MHRTNTKQLYVAGANAANMLGALFLFVNLLTFFGARRVGLTSPEDFLDPNKVLPIIKASPLFVYVFLLGIVFSACVLLVALACAQLLRRLAPMRATTATIVAMLHIGLALAADVPRVVAFPHLSKLYDSDPETASTAYLAVSAILGGLNGAALMLFGAWMILFCWTALKVRLLPKALCVSGVVIGGIHVACIFLPLPHVADIVWFPFLGLSLHRASRGSHES